MSSRIEKLLITSFNRENGWEKLYDIKEKIYFRAFRIGTPVSCNDDLVKDYSIKEQISNILDKKNIKYVLNEIDDRSNFSYQINIDENNYELLKSQYINI